MQIVKDFDEIWSKLTKISSKIKELKKKYYQGEKKNNK